MCLDEAIDKADRLDNHYANHGEMIGPLHGIPVTFKDQFHVRGMETTKGYAHWIGTFEGERDTGKDKVTDSLLVQQLGKLGAIPLGLVRIHLIS